MKLPSLNCRRRLMRLTLALVAGTAVINSGCTSDPPPKPIVRYPDMGDRIGLPPYMKQTVFEQTETYNTGYSLVSSFGLVVNLRGSGDSTAPAAVKNWMVKEMFVHGWGSVSMPEYKDLTPDRVLEDKRVAIVEVGGWIPPGARQGQQFDITVKCLAGNRTSSLAHGLLYLTSLREDGANRQNPGASVNEYAIAQGDIFVNPAYALNTTPDKTNIQASLRTGIIPGGGVCTCDRPIYLRLRHPSWQLANQIQTVINQRFQKIADRHSLTGGVDVVAMARDQGIVELYMPASFKGDWEHFVGVATHIYLYSGPGDAALKAQQLAAVAVRPGAPLSDISYTWEAIGESALPYIQPLLSHPSPDVAFAAARAAACLHDHFGEQRLMDIARTPGHPYRLTAVQTLGSMASPFIDAMLVDLLSADEASVRIEAYKVLIREKDPHITTIIVAPPEYPESQFALDMIDAAGPPLIYASRLGPPRIALFGQNIRMQLPVTFTALDQRLSMTEIPGRPNTLNIYYRDEATHEPVQVSSGPDVAELIARLGGRTKQGLHFSYGDVVAMLQSWSTSKKVPAAFVLQEIPTMQKPIDQGRIASELAARLDKENHDRTPIASGPSVGRPQ